MKSSKLSAQKADFHGNLGSKFLRPCVWLEITYPRGRNGEIEFVPSNGTDGACVVEMWFQLKLFLWNLLILVALNIFKVVCCSFILVVSNVLGALSQSTET